MTVFYCDYSYSLFYLLMFNLLVDLDALFFFFLISIAILTVNFILCFYFKCLLLSSKRLIQNQGSQGNGDMEKQANEA